MNRAWLAAAAAATILAAARTAAASHDDDEILAKRMRFIESGASLLLKTSVTEAFDAEAYDKLDTGLEAVVVIRIAVYREDQSTPIAYQLLRRRLVRDMWDDIYLVGFDGPGGRAEAEFETRAEALTALTELDRVPIAALADIALEAHYFVGIVVELNPVSAETMAEMRRWLTQRASSAGTLTSDSSFFGSFVSVFVNPKFDEADRIVRIRSQPFYRPRR